MNPVDISLSSLSSLSSSSSLSSLLLSSSYNDLDFSHTFYTKTNACIEFIPFVPQTKMEAEGIAPSAIAAFESSFSSLVSGATGMISESSISPVEQLVYTESINGAPNPSLLSKTVVCKLNGGLGTGMGLDKAKSLLKVKGEDTFLDLTAKQLTAMRNTYGYQVKFMLMNSFSTSEDTLNFFKEKYPTIAAEEGLEMLQNKVPKLDATTFVVRIHSTPL